MLSDTVRLESIDAKRNRYRVYRITTCRDLFGSPCVVSEWGRIGSRLRSRSEFFTTEWESTRRVVQLVAHRQQRGYKIAA